ncbi:hypothetical protein ACP0HM_29040 [Escherichia coli]
MHDLCAIARLVRPDLFTLKPCFVAVETQGEFTSGTTVVDIDGCTGQTSQCTGGIGSECKGFQRWVWLICWLWCRNLSHVIGMQSFIDSCLSLISLPVYH